MKKRMSAALLCSLMVISLAGCGSGGESTPSAGNSVPSGSDGSSTEGTTQSEQTTQSEETASTVAVGLAWSPPQGNIAGYNVYYGTSPGTYTNTIRIGSTPSYTVSGISPGTYYFAVTANDPLGNESGYSNEISRTIN